MGPDGPFTVRTGSSVTSYDALALVVPADTTQAWFDDVAFAETRLGCSD